MPALLRFEYRTATGFPPPVGGGNPTTNHVVEISLTSKTRFEFGGMELPLPVEP